MYLSGCSTVYGCSELMRTCLRIMIRTSEGSVINLLGGGLLKLCDGTVGWPCASVRSDNMELRC